MMTMIFKVDYLDKLFLSSHCVRSCLISSPSYLQHRRQKQTQARKKYCEKKYKKKPGTSKQWFNSRSFIRTPWVGWTAVGVALFGGLVLARKLLTERPPNELNTHSNAVRILQAAKSKFDAESQSTFTIDEWRNISNTSRKLPGTEDFHCDCKCKTVKIIKDFVQKYQTETENVGIAVAVSVDGKTVIEEGFGFADLGNNVPCTKDSVFRISSLTKPITMAAIAKLYENGKLDLDKPVQYYVPEFPKKTWNGEEVTITTRHLARHQSGLRPCFPEENFGFYNSNKKCHEPEYGPILMLTRQSIFETLDTFKDDHLERKPGNQLYSSPGYDLLGAVVERAAKEPFRDYIQNMLTDLGMNHTYFSENEDTIPNKVRQYTVSERGDIRNIYENYLRRWTSEGLSSTVGDLVRFGNIMLESYQAAGNGSNSLNFLSGETVKEMWTIEDDHELELDRYGMGWKVVSEKKKLLAVFHNGVNCGGQGVLIILPSLTDRVCESCTESLIEEEEPRCPKGIVISVLSNAVEVPHERMSLIPFTRFLVRSLLNKF